MPKVRIDTDEWYPYNMVREVKVDSSRIRYARVYDLSQELFDRWTKVDEEARKVQDEIDEWEKNYLEAIKADEDI